MANFLTRHKFASIILIILALGYFTTSIVFSFKYIQYDFENNQFIKEIESSLNGKPIIGLELSPILEKGKEKLSFGQWDGISDGCNCSNTIKSGICSDNDKKKCRDIKKIVPKQYFKINSSYFYIKRYSKTYRQLLEEKKILPKNTECPSNYKSCGIIDTLERQLCLEIEEECPINVEYMNNLIYNDINLFLDKENILNENKLHNNNFSYDDNNQILSIFKISEGTPCIDPKEKNWKYHYQLEPKTKNCTNIIMNQKFDKRYIQLIKFETSKYELYKDNDIKDFKEEYSKNETVYLYARNIIGFAGEKVKKFSYNELISLQKRSNRCGFGMKVLTYIMIGFISFPIFFLCGMAQNPGASCDEKGMGCFLSFYIGGTIISIIGAFLINIIFSIIIFVSYIKIESILDITESDMFTNELIKIIMNEYSRNFRFSLAITIIFGSTLVIGIVVLLFNMKSLRWISSNKYKALESNLMQIKFENNENKII